MLPVIPKAFGKEYHRILLNRLTTKRATTLKRSINNLWISKRMRLASLISSLKNVITYL
jgi:hypothetical protein